MPPKTANSFKGIKAQKNPAKGAAILKAAENIFAQKGFHAATVSDIARKAKVSEGTILSFGGDTTYIHGRLKKSFTILPKYYRNIG